MTVAKENGAMKQLTIHESIPPHLQWCLKLLRQACQYARMLERDEWDFAVEISNLRKTGITNSDLRWLVCKGYIAHASESLLLGEHQRQFHRFGELAFTGKTCFVLTDSGQRVTDQLGLENEQTTPSGCEILAVNGQGLHGASRPQWDASSQKLYLHGLVVKQFKLPSTNQTTVLAAFEEESWPARIDDPLPPARNTHPRRRLHDTIRSLNRHQKSHLIRFMGDGTGEGICWELTSRNEDDISN